MESRPRVPKQGNELMADAHGLDTAGDGRDTGDRRGPAPLWRRLLNGAVVLLILSSIACGLLWWNDREDHANEREVTCTVTDLAEQKPERRHRRDIFKRSRNLVLTSDCGTLERPLGIVGIEPGRAYHFRISGDPGSFWTDYAIIREYAPMPHQ